MSGGSDNFLSRWSRRKQEVAREAAVAEKKEVEATDTVAPPAEETAEAQAPVFDPTTLEVPLPDLADIAAGSDMTPFFQKGVPENLRNDALRKLWTIDPAIRDFVDPALDYAYDWNTPGGAPGYGPLSALDIARVAKMHLGLDGPEQVQPNLSEQSETKTRRDDDRDVSAMPLTSEADPLAAPESHSDFPDNEASIEQVRLKSLQALSPEAVHRDNEDSRASHSTAAHNGAGTTALSGDVGDSVSPVATKKRHGGALPR